ncbi:growth/differentiation factor 10b isoform X1 [Syngnathus scovelli]|uniref:growth/differentiation factor 10b isoform X1 n=1 Tax=Syngnathus scovelli TaxID=161590 RepID=UPI0021105251|nr:interferon gamma receptor 1-like isoform X1 [Syngnathus scovelli]
MKWPCMNTLLITFFLLEIGSAHVPPPRDVILHCGNLVNKVAWSYDNPPTGLRFRVDIGRIFKSQGDMGPLWVDPPDLQADVSFLSDQREDYFLAVTAVLGKEESEAAPADGISFSYYLDSPAAQKCSLDFPPVTVLDQHDNTVLISFQHPWLTYEHALLTSLQAGDKRKRRHVQPDNPLPVFKYDVTIDKKPFADLRCTEDVCERNLPVDASQQEHCATIKGELERIAVLGTHDYCAQPMQENKHIITGVVVSLLVLAAVLTVLLMICWKKTKASSKLPSSLRFNGFVDETPVASMPVSDSSARLIVEKPVSPGESEQSGEPQVHEESEQSDELQPHEEPELSGEDAAGDMEDKEHQAYMGGEQIDEDDDMETSNDNAYERRQVIVKMSSDEDIEGYRG